MWLILVVVVWLGTATTTTTTTPITTTTTTTTPSKETPIFTAGEKTDVVIPTSAIPPHHRDVVSTVATTTTQSHTPSEPVSTHRLALFWMMVVGLSLSCLALVLHLTAFCLLPSLRKLSDKCLASMCVSLLACYLLRFFRVIVYLLKLNQAGCVIFVATASYFHLCFFTWMTVIAFDVWYSFRKTHTQLHVATGTQNRRFLLYSVCGWVLPGVYVAVVMVLTQVELPGVSQYFLSPIRGPSCDVTGTLSMMLAIPTLVFLLSNVGFFIATVVLIIKMNQNAAVAASTRRQRYSSFLRLAVLMGLSWTTVILIPLSEHFALIFVLHVLKSLQGVFIFLTFTLLLRV